MSSVENDLLESIEDAGFEVSDTPEAVQEESQAPAGIPEGVAPDLDLSGGEENTQPVQEPVSNEQTETVGGYDPQPESSLNTENNVESYDNEDVDGLVMGYLSEKLGMDLSSLEDLRNPTTPRQAEIDERIKVIADFVEQTGRSPEDWFRYQAMNPSEMDDLTAVKLSMTAEYPDLNSEEIDMLVGNKYKIDEDLYTEDEIKLSKLQLKIDANKSRQSIEGLRNNYTMPEMDRETAVQSPIDEEWINSMKRETNALEALSFDLPGGEFEFGISDDYRGQLIDKNSNIETFFDQYVGQDGQWDYDLFNSHRALVDNIDAIAKSIYQQGLSDGQRRIVDQAANVSTKSPNVGMGNNTNNLEQQILDALNVDKTLRFL